jgi:DNA-binding CsgD family transcriptional regulator
MKYNDDIHLTPHEIKLIGCLIKEKSQKMMADYFKVKPITISNEMNTLHHKINCSSGFGVLSYAFMHGFVWHFEADTVYYLGTKVDC